MIDRKAAEQRERVRSIGTQRKRPPRTRFRIRQTADSSLGHRMGGVKRRMIRSYLKSSAVGGVGLVQCIERKQRIAEVQVSFRQPRLELDRPAAMFGRVAKVTKAMQHMT